MALEPKFLLRLGRSSRAIVSPFNCTANGKVTWCITVCLTAIRVILWLWEFYSASDLWNARFRFCIRALDDRDEASPKHYKSHSENNLIVDRGITNLNHCLDEWYWHSIHRIDPSNPLKAKLFAGGSFSDCIHRPNLQLLVVRDWSVDLHYLGKRILFARFCSSEVRPDTQRGT